MFQWTDGAYFAEELGFSEKLSEEMVFRQDEGNTTEVICKGKGTPPLDIRSTLSGFFAISVIFLYVLFSIKL